MTEKEMSFLPEDYIERRVELRTNVICLTLFGVVLAGVLGAYFVTSRQRAEVLEHQQAINASFTEAAKRISQLDELQAQKRRLLQKAQVASTLIEPVPRSNLLAELINRMPASLTLTDLELKTKKVQGVVSVAPPKGSALSAATSAAKKNAAANPVEAVPDVPQYQVDVSLIGIAPTDIQVAQYMASLARCELLTNVDLSYSEETRIDELSVRRFRIDMRLDPKADIRSIQPLSVQREAAGSLFGSVPTSAGTGLED